jgi:hypothetical protein
MPQFAETALPFLSNEKGGYLLSPFLDYYKQFGQDNVYP